MPSRADYRCRECGCEVEFFFDGIPPATHREDHPDPHHEICVGTFDRMWKPFHTGRGSSGEPPR